MKTNILILAARATHDQRDSGYPLCLSEVGGQPVIQRLLEQCAGVGEAQLIVMLPEEDCKRWNLDNVVRQLDPNVQIIKIQKPTAGAACTALLAVNYINCDLPLLILNGDELLELDFALPLDKFSKDKSDGGTIVFPSVHPRYSFVRLNEREEIVEAAEKNPISRHATAGFYWFRRGKDFVSAAQSSIMKRAHVGGQYYICPTLNEMILRQGKLSVYHLDAKGFHPLKSERQIERYELHPE